MDLRDCRFYCCSGYGLSFSVYSDQPCCARLRDRIRLPIYRQDVEMYEIEPGPQTRWVVVHIYVEYADQQLRLFVRRNNRFEERDRTKLPPLRVQREIARKVPRLRRGQSWLYPNGTAA